MNEGAIKELIVADRLRRRAPNKERILSMIESAQERAAVAKTVPLTEKSATLIFCETYEAIRQLGDARWWINGYEPRDHEVDMDILMELNIKDKTVLFHLPRFKTIRNDANYRGYKATLSQAKEISEFWDKCGDEIARLLCLAANAIR